MTGKIQSLLINAVLYFGPFLLLEHRILLDTPTESLDFLVTASGDVEPGVNWTPNPYRGNVVVLPNEKGFLTCGGTDTVSNECMIRPFQGGNAPFEASASMLKTRRGGAMIVREDGMVWISGGLRTKFNSHIFPRNSSLFFQMMHLMNVTIHLRPTTLI